MEILHANSKNVEIVWYAVSRGYVDLIRIYDVLKIVPFFGPPDIVFPSYNETIQTKQNYTHHLGCLV